MNIIFFILVLGDSLNISQINVKKYSIQYVTVPCVNIAASFSRKTW